MCSLKLKFNKQLELIPWVISSPSREMFAVALVRQPGVNARVVKPVEFQELNDTLTYICRLWSTINESVNEMLKEKAASKLLRN